MEPTDPRPLQEQAADLAYHLGPSLYDGVFLRLREPSWYLTGVQIGLESLYALFEISDLVYRDQDGESESGRRLKRIQLVYEELSRFGTDELGIEGRAQLMVAVREPLEILLGELEGIEAAPIGRKRRKPIIQQLAADIHLSLVRLRTFEKMKAPLVELDAFRFVVFRRARQRKVTEFCSQYGPYGRVLGFGDPAVLLDKPGRVQVAQNIGEQADVVENRLTNIHQKIFSGRFKDLSSGDKKVDLEEARLMVVLQKIFAAGFEYLTRAHSIYAHGLALVGGSTALLEELSRLTLAIEEQRALRSTPPLK